MVGFVNLLSSRQKASQKQCPRGGESRMRWKGGAGTTRGVADFPGNEQGGCKCIRQTARMGLGGPRHLNHPTWFYALGLSKEVAREVSFTYCLWILYLNTSLTSGNEWTLLSIPSTSSKSRPCPGSVRQHQGARPQKPASEHLPSVSFLAHWHSSPWNKVLAPFSFQDFVLGELEHLSADRLPLRIWARLTGSSALTNDVIDGQNKEEHTKKHFCLVWCVSKPSSSGCWRYILLHASLHSNGIPRQSCFFSWHKTAGSFMGAGPTEPGGRSSTKERSFPKVPQVAFLLSWI